MNTGAGVRKYAAVSKRFATTTPGTVLLCHSPLSVALCRRTRCAGNAARYPSAHADRPRKKLDDRVAHLSARQSVRLLGPTRGIYLDGYGAVFTAEINLVSAPPP